MEGLSKNYSDFRMCPILSNHKFKMTAINIACIYEEHSNHRPTNYEIHKKWKESKHNTIESHQDTREECKKMWKEQGRNAKTIRKQLIKWQ